MNWTVAERKVPGGKLLRVKCLCSEGHLVQVRIEGDFFLYPEEGLARLEEALIGALPHDGADISSRLQRAIDAGGMQLIGFAKEDVVELLGGMQ